MYGDKMIVTAMLVGNHISRYVVRVNNLDQC